MAVPTAQTTAIVIGGSMTGLLAVRVLSRRFENVILLERTGIAAEPLASGGDPQARYLQTLSPHTQIILDYLFPGLTAEFLESGAHNLDFGCDCLSGAPDGGGLRFTSGMQMISASRPLIEHAVRGRVAAIPNVTIRTGVAAEGLLTDSFGRRVIGVSGRYVDTALPLTLSAELVVDTSGRLSRAAQWLVDVGYPAVDETVVHAHLGYASRIYRRASSDERDFQAIFIQADPPDRPRAGFAFPIEGDRWIVTLCGGGRDYAPTDEPGFLGFARSLPNPQLYKILADSQPLGPILGYRRTENRMRHYHRMRRFPAGFVVAGEAACAFNPIYGQVYGQRLALDSSCVLELDTALAAHQPSTLARRFHSAQARACMAPWTLATAEDHRYRKVDRVPPSAAPGRFIRWYLHHATAAANTGCNTRYALLQAAALMAPLSSLFRPPVAWEVLRRALAGSSRAVEFEPPCSCDCPPDCHLLTPGPQSAVATTQ